MVKDKLVYIEWDDACSNGGWEPRHGLKARTYRVRSAGFLIDEDKHSVVIATNISYNEKVSETMTIPKGMVRKRKTIASYDKLPKE